MVCGRVDTILCPWHPKAPLSVPLSLSLSISLYLSRALRQLWIPSPDPRSHLRPPATYAMHPAASPAEIDPPAHPTRRFFGSACDEVRLHKELPDPGGALHDGGDAGHQPAVPQVTSELQPNGLVWRFEGCWCSVRNEKWNDPAKRVSF